MRERRTEDAEENQEDGRRRQTHEKGGETHIVAVALLHTSVYRTALEGCSPETARGIIMPVHCVSLTLTLNKHRFLER